MIILNNMKRTFCFIDASNLSYGGEKSLGWKIDYSRLLEYLKEKYNVDEVYYFGGVEIHDFHFDYINEENVDIERLEKYIKNLIETKGGEFNEAMLLLISKHLDKIKFYKKIQSFGYKMILKPVKIYTQEDGTTKRKANCDVDLSFFLMRDKDIYDRALILSGDGDFLPVLKHIKNVENKEVIILSRQDRTAREIKQFAGSNFRDFTYLEKYIKIVR